MNADPLWLAPIGASVVGAVRLVLRARWLLREHRRLRFEAERSRKLLEYRSDSPYRWRGRRVAL